MGVPQTMMALRERADFMKESLQKSQTITDNMVAILGSFDHRLSALETAMRPTQVPHLLPFFSPLLGVIEICILHCLQNCLQIRTHSIRRAHENIDKTLKAAEVILAQFDLTRKVDSSFLYSFFLFWLCLVVR